MDSGTSTDCVEVTAPLRAPYIQKGHDDPFNKTIGEVLNPTE